MGIVPDLSAIQAAKKNAKKIKASVKKDYKKSVKKAEEELSEHHKAQDIQALESLRREGFQSLLNDLVNVGYDEPDVILGDPELLHDWRVQNIKHALEQTAGPALEDAVRALRSDFAKNSILEKVADSDGDLDLSNLGEMVNENQGDSSKNELEVIYRDQDGFRITREKWLEYQREKKGGYKGKKQTPPTFVKQPSVEWGIGLQQIKEREERFNEEQKIASKPLTQYEIDESLNQHLKEEIRWADPLREMARVSQRENNNELPSCPFPSPPNRFNIKAGYRWDGVIRGNGFEQRLLMERNKMRFREVEAYKWSIEDV